MASLAQAYQITWEDLSFRTLRNNNQWGKILVTTEVSIFDPFAKDQNTTPPQPIEERGFRQSIYWHQNEYLIVKTFDHQEQLLHFYYESEGRVISRQTQEERLFSTEDILPHYFLFIVTHPHDWEKALQSMEIRGKQISLWEGADDQIFYRIGGGAEDPHFALIDQKSFLLKELHSQIATPYQLYPLRIVFSDLQSFRRQEYPQQVDHFLDGRLFKRVRATKVRYMKELPEKRLLEEAKQWSLPSSPSMTINYAQ